MFLFSQQGTIFKCKRIVDETLLLRKDNWQHCGLFYLKSSTPFEDYIVMQISVVPHGKFNSYHSDRTEYLAICQILKKNSGAIQAL